jgi:hypothetical protein
MTSKIPRALARLSPMSVWGFSSSLLSTPIGVRAKTIRRVFRVLLKEREEPPSRRLRCPQSSRRRSYEDRRQIRRLLPENFVGEGALSRNDQGIVEGMNEGQAGCLDQFIAVLRVGIPVAEQDGFRIHPLPVY